jgi:hypothetical protein
MNVILTALVIWSLPFLGVSCGSTSIQERQPVAVQASPTQNQAAAVTLTTEHPLGVIPIDAELLNNPPKVLEVSVTKVVNSGASPVNIFVYLSSGAETKDPDADKISVGNFSLYPVDRPGKFMLDPAPAFRKFSEAKKSAEKLRLVFEMQLDADKKPSQPVEVTVAAPNWKR